jgi:lysozyme
VKTSHNGRKIIQEFEGFRSTPYLCSAEVPTIGFGSTMYLNGTKVKLSDPDINRAEAENLFVKTLTKYEDTVNKTTKGLNQNQFDACVSLCYNIGQEAFTSSTLVKMINAGTAPDLIAPQFLRWNKVKGKPDKGLTRRREAEMALFLSNTA